MPVAAILSYMVLRSQDTGPRFADSRLLTRDWFVTAVQSTLSNAGYNCSLYTGHSFCIGAATTVAQCGISDALKRDAGPMAELSLHHLYLDSPRRPVLGGPTTGAFTTDQCMIDLHNCACVAWPEMAIACCL